MTSILVSSFLCLELLARGWVSWLNLSMMPSGAPSCRRGHLSFWLNFSVGHLLGHDVASLGIESVLPRIRMFASCRCCIDAHGGPFRGGFSNRPTRGGVACDDSCAVGIDGGVLDNGGIDDAEGDDGDAFDFGKTPSITMSTSVAMRPPLPRRRVCWAHGGACDGGDGPSPSW